ncbi:MULTISPECIES: asparagine synthase (glutamine-hydrolyzing) [unclassified Bradyrhizobium]|uniref:asparagine synthase (glutamine-hydrolyzing) n=1 Tax=unclassified Bradyrhizobium TaxID=2631580 RepID=UPI0029164723|nr:MULTISPECIES: asparagine synthase (glutamine-hydrolyzing) [unclassified Bradyrhizobium]
MRGSGTICGIFGIAATDPCAEVDTGRVRHCVDRVRYRGPDAIGVLAGPGFAFGHARLSVLDTGERSNQPFVEPRSGVLITYNGELYNFRDLRKRLEGLGARFRTESDTEVMLQAYLFWGRQSVDRFDGMFAFGLYDPRTAEAWLVRDRIGVKPLYYLERPEGVLFGSQPSALLAWPGVQPAIDGAAVSAFLSYRSPLGARSLFEGIRALEPGQMAVVRRGKVALQRWWAPVSASDKYSRSVDVRGIIAKAVRKQLVADVPVAALLSGGIDSSIVAYEATSSAQVPITYFTGVVSGATYDETPFARAVTDRFGLNHQLIPISVPADVASVRPIVACRSQPLAMHNEAAMFTLAQAVARDHKVVLTGEGSDELFCGYGRIFRLPFERMRAALNRWAPRWLQRQLRRRWELREEDLDELDLFLTRYSYFPAWEKLELANEAWRRILVADTSADDHFARQFAEAGGAYMDRITAVFVRTHLPALLEMVDNTTMAAGLEARVPFTDHHLVEAALSLPHHQKLRWRNPLAFMRALASPVAEFSERDDTPKYILRKLYSDVLPGSVLGRPKMGFPLPLGHWAVSPASTSFRSLLFRETPAIAQFIDCGALRRWYERSSSNPTDAFGKKLWLLCNLELFLRQHGP